MRRAYKVVDVFTTMPLLGNPVAVVLDAEGLGVSAMQAIARWTNLSETTFVLPPTRAEADYRLRIFTPGRELPFAGHPTLGSAHAVLESGRARGHGGGLIQECGVGLVELTAEGGRVTLGLPDAELRPLPAPDIDELEGVLGGKVMREVAPAIVDVGAVWVVAQLASAEAVLALKPDFARSAAFERRLGVTGVSVFGPHPAGGDAAIEVRSFAPSVGVPEDPVCGSGNGSVAVFRRERGLLARPPSSYVATQGRCVGRDGRVAVSFEASGHIRLGGACVTVAEGSLSV